MLYRMRALRLVQRVVEARRVDGGFHDDVYDALAEGGDDDDVEDLEHFLRFTSPFSLYMTFGDFLLFCVLRFVWCVCRCA